MSISLEEKILDIGTRLDTYYAQFTLKGWPVETTTIGNLRSGNFPSVSMSQRSQH